MKWKDGDLVFVLDKYSHKAGVRGKVVDVNKDRDEVLVEFTDGVRNWFVPDWLEAEADRAEAPKAQGGGKNG